MASTPDFMKPALARSGKKRNLSGLGAGISAKDITR
jgi:hypothetical protein